MQKEKKVILAFHHSTRYTYIIKKKTTEKVWKTHDVSPSETPVTTLPRKR